MSGGFLVVVFVKLKGIHGTLAFPVTWHPALVAIVAFVFLLCLIIVTNSVNHFLLLLFLPTLFSSLASRTFEASSLTRLLDHRRFDHLCLL